MIIKGIKKTPIKICIDDSLKTTNLYHVSPNINNLSKMIKKSNKKHLIILVHGFQACSLDLEILQNAILHLFPSC